LSWGPGKTIINLYILDHELEPLQELRLKPKDARHDKKKAPLNSFHKNRIITILAKTRLSKTEK